ncbi:hypothetical protein OG930_01195 [Streptomyces sp. NBC_01799]|uniref:hypothetical protein n=1 Tax=Streptomyces sp. NBC_01800 TaxID=2975945 RepID=UPI002DDC364F|nr:hypothetical protein [Streptomyces sp. NBC_01800]WSA65768.1 hypothetical protein OIE65_01275 [Streptomyces sp. NBC_01800]WSA74368.1 hypothetical protein OG930_01195 [Streptomyces sp. NBC_01799]
MSIPSLLLDRLRRAGLSDAVSVTPAEGGVTALAGIATRREGSPSPPLPRLHRHITLSAAARTC